MIKTIDAILSADLVRDARDAEICALLGISAPGAVAVREPDGRLLVWASEADSQGDDGRRATYRSRQPISAAAWQAVRGLAYVESATAI